MEGMGKFIRWVAVFAALTVLTALFEPLVVAQLQEFGWYDNPSGTLGPVLNWLAGLLGAELFPWVAAGTLGFAAGVWLDWLSRKVDSQRPDKQTSFRNMSRELGALSRQLGNAVSYLESDPVQAQGQLISLSPDLKSTALKLEALDITTPLSHGLSPFELHDPTRIQTFENEAFFWMQFINQMRGLSEGGHYKAAKDDAKQFLSRAVTATEDSQLQSLPNTEPEKQP